MVPRYFISPLKFFKAYNTWTVTVWCTATWPLGMYYWTLRWGILSWVSSVYQLIPPGQNGCYITEDIFKCIFLNVNAKILIWISLNFVTKGPIDNPTTRVGFLPEETYFFQDTRKKVEETYFFQFCPEKTGRNWTKLEKTMKEVRNAGKR